jgi:hypothetical protein
MTEYQAGRSPTLRRCPIPAGAGFTLRNWDSHIFLFLHSLFSVTEDFSFDKGIYKKLGSIGELAQMR